MMARSESKSYNVDDKSYDGDKVRPLVIKLPLPVGLAKNRASPVPVCSTCSPSLLLTSCATPATVCQEGRGDAMMRFREINGANTPSLRARPDDKLKLQDNNRRVDTRDRPGNPATPLAGKVSPSLQRDVCFENIGFECRAI